MFILLHTFNICDNTSSFFRQGKIKFVNLLDKNNKLQDIVSIFVDNNANAK